MDSKENGESDRVQEVCLSPPNSNIYSSTSGILAHSSRPAPSRSPHTSIHSPLTPYSAPGLPSHATLSNARSEISHRPSLQNTKGDSGISRGTSTVRDEEPDNENQADEPRREEGGEVEAVEEEHVRERESNAIEKGIVSVEEAEELHQM